MTFSKGQVYEGVGGRMAIIEAAGPKRVTVTFVQGTGWTWRKTHSMRRKDAEDVLHGFRLAEGENDND